MICRCYILFLEVFARAHVSSDKPTTNKLFIVISSDKGLCGGIHSSISKATRRTFNNAPDSRSPLAGASANDAIVVASFSDHGHWRQVKSPAQSCPSIQPTTHFQPNWSQHSYFRGCSWSGGFDHAEWCEIWLQVGGPCVQQCLCLVWLL